VDGDAVAAAGTVAVAAAMAAIRVTAMATVAATIVTAAAVSAAVTIVIVAAGRFPAYDDPAIHGASVAVTADIAVFGIDGVAAVIHADAGVVTGLRRGGSENDKAQEGGEG